MKIDWTPSGGALVTLGDDAPAAGARTATKLEELGGEALEQLDPLAFADFVSRLMRGNVQGDCVFTARKSHADVDTAAAYFKAEYSRQGQKGSLVLTFGATTMTMANATCRAVRVVLPDGVHWILRYKFGITTIT